MHYFDDILELELCAKINWPHKIIKYSHTINNNFDCDDNSGFKPWLGQNNFLFAKINFWHESEGTPKP